MYTKEQLKEWVMKIYNAITNDSVKQCFVTYDKEVGFTVCEGDTVPDEAVIEIDTRKAPFYPNRGNSLYFDDTDAFTQADMFEFCVKNRIDSGLSDLYDNDGYGIPNHISKEKAIEFYDSLTDVIKEFESEMDNIKPFAFPQIERKARPKTDDEIYKDYLIELRDSCG